MQCKYFTKLALRKCLFTCVSFATARSALMSLSITQGEVPDRLTDLFFKAQIL